MTTTIDSAGRLVIPREIRRLAGLKPGMPLDVTFRDGHIEIEPVQAPVRLVRKGRFLVAERDVPVPPITDEDVEATREMILRERFEECLAPLWAPNLCE